MKTETIARSKIGKSFIRLMAKAMESRFRYRFFNPVEILQGVDDLHGKSVLEIGCGTGFFTVPAAGIIGDHGNLLAMDILSESVEFVSRKVQDAKLQNVRVVKGDALNTNLESESFSIVILFGVIPAPMLPLTPILNEMHRILKPEGILAVWPPVPGLFPRSILKSGLFSLASKRNGVNNFKRI
jgi:demethylmenaquinone methyltransferase/2-methoxy-6-polyprenyl-1,4-benzoquinol methylase